MNLEFTFCLLVGCCFFQNISCYHIKPDCSTVDCRACPKYHKAVTVKHECCPRCIPQCLCPAFLVDECIDQGYKDKILLLEQSVYTDFHTRVCTCKSVQNIICHSICPKIPPECKHIERPLDGCPFCA